jgi:pimeloyl-ACP methyl ester carboxylesterase
MFLPGFDDHRQTVTTPSAELSYIDIGAGPPALFVHGIATNAYLWHRLIAQLTDQRRCIAVDLPLHGRSPATPTQELTVGALADVLAEFCERLDLNGLDLVANDTGGAIAQVLAARHPRLLRTLTLTNCETRQTIPPAAMAATVQLARSGQLAPAAAAIFADPVASRAFFEAGYEDPAFLSSDLVQAFLEPVIGSAAAAERFQELISTLGPADLLTAEPALRNLRVPTLIAWGTDDQFFDLKWAYWLQGMIPSAREVIEITGGKLFFPHERAAELASHLLCYWAAPASGGEPLPGDLIDGLWDALDEYDAGAADLPALVHDVDSVIVELAPLSDPTWIGQLREQSRILAGALERTRASQTASVSSSQIERIAAATTALRRLLSVAV